MTGRYQQRHGWEFNPAGRATSGMDAEQTTVADVLKSAGYQTSMVGKWHLGYLPQFHPLSRGFHDYFGVLAGSIFIDQSRPGSSQSVIGPVSGSVKGVYDGTALVQVDEY